MSAADALGAVLAALEHAGIAHMLTGSFAGSLHGVARSTADIDIVIDPTAGNIDRFIDRLDPEQFYFDRFGARAAVADRDQFNVIDMRSGWKIDLLVRKERPFSVMEFSRRAPATVLGFPVFVATAEDTVLSKLEWAALGGSDRQVRDVVELLRVAEGRLDDAYLDRWAAELAVSSLLASARTQASG